MREPLCVSNNDPISVCGRRSFSVAGPAVTIPTPRHCQNNAVRYEHLPFCHCPPSARYLFASQCPASKHLQHLPAHQVRSLDFLLSLVLEPIDFVGVHPTQTASAQQYSDPLDRFWHLYLVDADKQDQKLADRWKGDTDGILIFVRFASILTLGKLTRALEH
jgi:hypothetical protein